MQPKENIRVAIRVRPEIDADIHCVRCDGTANAVGIRQQGHNDAKPQFALFQV